MKISKVLNKAKDFLERKEWCQGCDAVDKNKNPTDCFSRKAVAFCVGGAVFRVKSGNELTVVDFLEDMLKMPVDEWNDKRGRTKIQVINMLNRAIKKAEKAEQAA